MSYMGGMGEQNIQTIQPHMICSRPNLHQLIDFSDPTHHRAIATGPHTLCDSSEAAGLAGLRSPYPDLDRFIASTPFLTTAGGLQPLDSDPTAPDAKAGGKVQRARGVIKAWRYLPAGGLVQYSVSGSRWCYVAGRNHKSNGIYIVADVKLKMCYQKCHDPDCKGARSPALPLPDYTLLSSAGHTSSSPPLSHSHSHTQGQQTLSQTEKERQEEEEILKALERVEQGLPIQSYIEEDLELEQALAGLPLPLPLSRDLSLPQAQGTSSVT